jgi:uncharacterized Ntn-hydrolase superfamily protein
MPLQQSASNPAFQSNLRKLLKEGYPRKQALAIALSVQKRNAVRRRKQ